MKKMLAAVLRGVDQFQIEECPIPEPGPGEVLVEVRACGFFVRLISKPFGGSGAMFLFRSSQGMNPVVSLPQWVPG